MAVTLTHPILIGQTEVTIQQWVAAELPVPTYPREEGGCGVPQGNFPCAAPCLEESCPVASVNWYEALTFANLLSERNDPPLAPCYKLTGCRGTIGQGDYFCGVEATGIVYDDAGLPSYAPPVYECEGFRLLTDAEWEYAARAGTRTAYYSGDITEYGDHVLNGTYCNADANLEAIGRYCWNSGGRARTVKGLMPNLWGLHDMSGNVMEWINDRSDGLPAQSPSDPDGRVVVATTSKVRGGSFLLWSSVARSAARHESTRDYRSMHLGFRLARTLGR